jgi:4'-phosphopantetheinyl transferase
MVRIFICDKIDEADERWLCVAVRKLPPERRAQTMRYRQVEDRTLCAATYLLMKYALKMWYDTDFTDDIAYTLDGKPYLANCQEIHISLSHTHGAAVCAIADEPVGVDIEEIQEYNPDIVAYCCNRTEQHKIEQTENRDEMFTEIWTQKESSIKLIGRGELKNAAEDNGLWRHTLRHGLYICGVCCEREQHVELIELPIAAI